MDSGLGVECENEQELYFACKMLSAEHNRWQKDRDYTREWIEETEKIEQDVCAFLEEEDSSSGSEDGYFAESS